MKRIIYIGGMMMAFVLCMTNCTQEEVVQQPEAPADGYIYFNTETDSRADLVTDMKGKNFGVTAFNYSNEVGVNWHTVKVKATPNVFHNQLIRWESNKHTYDVDNIAAGNQLKAWEGGKKYAFFAHYPYVGDHSGVQISSGSVENTPYITYTLNKNAMVDVMTASKIDVDNTLSNAVGLTFNHRLVAMDIQARNLIDPIGDKDIYVRLNSLTLTFTNQKYNKARIWLDESMGIDSLWAENWNTRQDYAVVNGNSITLEPMGDASSEDASVNVSDSLGTTLIILPQEGTNAADCLQGQVSFTYEYVDANGNVLKNLRDEQNQKIEPQNDPVNFTTGKAMVSGRKYAFQMNFSRTMVTIGIVEQGEWTDKNIDIEFE